jgi:hypothetical protein
MKLLTELIMLCCVILLFNCTTKEQEEKNLSNILYYTKDSLNKNYGDIGKIHGKEYEQDLLASLVIDSLTDTSFILDSKIWIDNGPLRLTKCKDSEMILYSLFDAVDSSIKDTLVSVLSQRKVRGHAYKMTYANKQGIDLRPNLSDVTPGDYMFINHISCIDSNLILDFQGLFPLNGARYLVVLRNQPCCQKNKQVH